MYSFTADTRRSTRRRRAVILSEITTLVLNIMRLFSRKKNKEDPERLAADLIGIYSSIHEALPNASEHDICIMIMKDKYEKIDESVYDFLETLSMLSYGVIEVYFEEAKEKHAFALSCFKALVALSNMGHRTAKEELANLMRLVNAFEGKGYQSTEAIFYAFNNGYIHTQPFFEQVLISIKNR